MQLAWNDPPSQMEDGRTGLGLVFLKGELSSALALADQKLLTFLGKACRRACIED